MLIPRTKFMRRKFRSTIAALTALIVSGLCIALPGTASAQIAVSAFPVPPTLDQPSPNTDVSQAEPAIEPAPDGSNVEWFLVNAQWQDLLSMTPTGTMAHVGTGFATDVGPPDAYASVDADGFGYASSILQDVGRIVVHVVAKIQRVVGRWAHAAGAVGEKRLDAEVARELDRVDAEHASRFRVQRHFDGRR